MEPITTILGGLLGGGLRLAPEILKWFDRKNERAHEAAMFNKQIEADKLRATQKLDELNASGQFALDAAGLGALTEAIRGQSQQSGVKWIDGLSQLMRPVITLQWVVILYPGVIVATFYLLLQSGVPAAEALLKVFGPDERSMVAGIVNFWFLDRVIRRRA